MPPLEPPRRRPRSADIVVAIPLSDAASDEWALQLARDRLHAWTWSHLRSIARYLETASSYMYVAVFYSERRLAVSSAAVTLDFPRVAKEGTAAAATDVVTAGSPR